MFLKRQLYLFFLTIKFMDNKRKSHQKNTEFSYYRWNLLKHWQVGSSAKKNVHMCWTASSYRSSGISWIVNFISFPSLSFFSICFQTLGGCPDDLMRCILSISFCKSAPITPMFTFCVYNLVKGHFVQTSRKRVIFNIFNASTSVRCLQHSYCQATGLV